MGALRFPGPSRSPGLLEGQILLLGVLDINIIKQAFMNQLSVSLSIDDDPSLPNGHHDDPEEEEEEGTTHQRHSPSTRRSTTTGGRSRLPCKRRTRNHTMSAPNVMSAINGQDDDEDDDGISPCSIYVFKGMFLSVSILDIYLLLAC